MAAQVFKRRLFKTLSNEDDLKLFDTETKLFHPYRMLIMKILLRHGVVEFRELKHDIPEITDGNLASHLRVLEELKYIRCHKEVVSRKIRTNYEITPEGREEFSKLIVSLRKVIENVEQV